MEKLESWSEFLVNDSIVLAPSQEVAMKFYHCFYPEPIFRCYFMREY